MCFNVNTKYELWAHHILVSNVIADEEASIFDRSPNCLNLFIELLNVE